MELTERQKKIIYHMHGSKYPAILIQDGKHGNSYWLVNTDEELVRAFRAMVHLINDLMRYYCGDEEHLEAALAGDLDALIRFVTVRGDHEYEGWRVESIEKLHPDW